MTYDEVLQFIHDCDFPEIMDQPYAAIVAIIELHQPQEITLPDGSYSRNCRECDGWDYPCQTITTIKMSVKPNVLHR